MDNVQFDNEGGFKSRTILGGPQTPKMVDLIIKTKLAKTPEGAFKVLIGISILFILVSIYLVTYTLGITNISPDDERFKLNEEQIMTFPPEVQEEIRNSQGQ